jgi:hypothetical protein
MRYYLSDLASLVFISAVISVVFNLAKNQRSKPLAIEIAKTFGLLVVGIVACGAVLVALSPWI